MVTKLTLEYDGTDFIGWARQPGLRTVQEEVERALRTVLGESAATGEPLTLTVAGRTDRGVHAWGQVASYAHEAVDPRRLNGLLPEDISILAAEPAAEDFDARRDAASRTYCYRLITRRSREVFARRCALWWPIELDLDALNACARALHGTHDFTAFTPTDTEHVRFERDILRAEWRRGDADRALGEGPLEFWIEADTFMRHMNRILVGTMLEIASVHGRSARGRSARGRSGRENSARGHSRRLGVDDFERLLTGRPRSEAGPTAPAHGLALAAVTYPNGT